MTEEAIHQLVDISYMRGFIGGIVFSIAVFAIGYLLRSRR